MLTPELETDFVAELPEVFLPIRGGWGRMGMTHIRLWFAIHFTLCRLHEIRHALIDDDCKSITEGGRGIISQNENIEFACTKVVAINRRKSASSSTSLSSRATRRSKSSIEFAANCKTN